MAVTRLSGGTTPANGSDPRTFPAIWNATADVIEANEAAIDSLDFYSKTNILGTVSQSGGVPTGAVIERGSNVNGDYVKYADGTQICTYAGSMSRRSFSRYTQSFSVNFSTAPFVWCGTKTTLGDVRSGIIMMPANLTTSSWFFLARNPRDVGLGSGEISNDPLDDCTMVAIGRWF